MYFSVFANYAFQCFILYFEYLILKKYNSDLNCNESNYWILELRTIFFNSKPFFICFIYTKLYTEIFKFGAAFRLQNVDYI